MFTEAAASVIRYMYPFIIVATLCCHLPLCSGLLCICSLHSRLSNCVCPNLAILSIFCAQCGSAVVCYHSSLAHVYTCHLQRCLLISHKCIWWQPVLRLLHHAHYVAFLLPWAEWHMLTRHSLCLYYSNVVVCFRHGLCHLQSLSGTHKFTGFWRHCAQYAFGSCLADAVCQQVSALRCMCVGHCRKN